MYMMNGFLLTKRKDRKVQVKFDGTDKWISSGCDTKEEATQWANANKQIYVNNGKADPTIKEFTEYFWMDRGEGSIWMRNQMHKLYYKHGYYRSMQDRTNNYIIPVFGNKKMSTITPYMVDEWFVGIKSVMKKGEYLSDYSKNKVMYCLSLMFDEAIRTEKCVSNPCDKVRKIREEHKERLPLLISEMDILFPSDDQKAIWVWGNVMWTCYFHIMRCTGFRPGEIAGLRKDNYFPDLGGIYTMASVDTPTKKVQQSIKTSKSGKKYKVGLLNEQCLRLLNQLVKSLPEEQKYLFQINGGVLASFTSNKHFKACLKRADIPLEERSQYSLRHTFQTLVAGEIEKSEVEELMGHTKFRKSYDHRDGVRRLTQLQKLRGQLESIV
jgi:integrase